LAEGRGDLHFVVSQENEFLQVQSEIGVQLKDLGLAPGVSFFLKGVKVTKIKGFVDFNLACKWKRRYRGWALKKDGLF